MYNKKISVLYILHTVVNFKEVFNLDKSARVLEISNDQLLMQMFIFTLLWLNNLFTVVLTQMKTK